MSATADAHPYAPIRWPARGGTPATAESIRAGLVCALKESVGHELIRDREEQAWRRVRDRWLPRPGIGVLGNTDAPRLRWSRS
ncbi:hypothetical protein SALBM135S_06359 [Streptomyces alboniger]